MIVAIHQPNYVPWLGYFYKMLKADVFVFLDNVQFVQGRSFQSRNRIKTANGVIWLTQPVMRKSRSLQRTDEVEFADPDWRTRHLKTIATSYKRARAFGEVYPALEDAYLSASSERLADFNRELIIRLADMLGIATRFVKASDLPVSGSSTDLLIDICRKVGGNAYLSGSGGANYQDAEAFNAAGIRLLYSDFYHPTYPQLWGDFVPNLSVLDLLLNVGAEARSILEQARAPVADTVAGQALR